jgi:hypothetical protein
MEGTFHNIDSDGHGSGADADLIYHPSGNMHAEDFGAGAGNITGAIILWYGSGDVPEGWHIADGTEGTVDLRDCFILGAGGLHSPGTTGGSNTFTAQGSLIVGGHAVTVDEMGPHKHPYNDYYGDDVNLTQSGSQLSGNADPYLPPQYTGYAGGNTPHGHNGSTVAVNAADALPPYYALYYIQKI